MFGEKPIYGQSIINSDNKRRIALPAFTKAAPEDSLIVIKEEEGIRLVDASVVDEYVEYLETKLKEELDPKKRRTMQKGLSSIYESIMKESKCDKNKRIHLGEIVKPNQTYLVIGCRTSILIKEHNESPKKLELSQIEKEYKPNL